MATRPTVENQSKVSTVTRTQTTIDLISGKETVVKTNKTNMSYQRHRSKLQWGKKPMSQNGTWLNPRGFAAGEVKTISISGYTLTQSGPNRVVRVEDDSYPVNTALRYIHGGIQLGAVHLPTFMQGRAETEALLKLKDQKVNYGLALLESKKTISHLALTTSQVLRAYRYGKRGKWKKAAETLKVRHSFKGATRDASSRWLELQYAWKPLLNDIYGTYEDLRRKWRKPYIPLSVVRNVKQSDNTLSAGNPSFEGSGTYTCQVKLWYYIKDEDLSTAVTMGLINPAILAWELVPFSFVVDWFAPIGNTLDALDAGVGLNFLSGTIVKRITGTGAVVWKGGISGEIRQSFEYRSIERGTYGSFPIPKFYLKNPFSSSHTITALALFRNLAFKR